MRDDKGLQTQGRKRYHFVKNQFYTFFPGLEKEQGTYNGSQLSEDIKKGIYKSLLVKPACSN